MCSIRAILEGAYFFPCHHTRNSEQGAAEATPYPLPEHFRRWADYRSDVVFSWSFRGGRLRCIVLGKKGEESFTRDFGVVPSRHIPKVPDRGAEIF